MQDFTDAFVQALQLIKAFDGDLREIIALSLLVSLSSVGIAAMIGMPLGAFLATTRFPLRSSLIVFTSAMMGLPPVVVGLVVYLLLSNAGALGPLQLLYTPMAMIIAQTLLVTPIVIALTHQAIEALHHEYEDQLTLLGVSSWVRLRTLLWEGRYALLTTLLAGFGRAIAEVGAVIIVGGNINHVTAGDDNNHCAGNVKRKFIPGVGSWDNSGRYRHQCKRTIDSAWAVVQAGCR